MASFRTTPATRAIAVAAAMWAFDATTLAQAPPPAPAPAALPLSGLPVTARASVALAAAPAHPPAIGAGHVFVSLSSGQLVAYRAADLREAWTLDLAAEQPPVASGDLVLVVSKGVLHARRAGDGEPAWTVDVGPVTAAPRAVEGWVIVSGRQLIALRAADGSLVWAQESEPLAAPASVEGDRVYVPLRSGRIEARDLATGALAWSVRLGGTPTGILALPDRLFVGAADGFFYTLDAASGQSPWQFPVRTGLRGRPAAHERLVFTISLDNLLRAYDRGHGARTWNQSIPYRGIAGPVVVEGSVVVPGLAASLPVFEAATGARQAPLAFGEPLVVPFAIGDDRGGRLLAAVTGSLSSGWQLVLRDSTYAVPLAPLTALPGEALPPPAPPARR